MKDWQSMAHVKWEGKYHIVFIPKYRKKKLYGKIRKRVGEIFQELCRYFGNIFTNALSDVYTDHLKKFLRLLLDLLENVYNLWYADFYFHGCFSLLSGLIGLTLSKGKAPFFKPF
jgi:hypothetical protein